MISHGFGEHGGAYGHVAEALAPALEIDVVAHDFHGHGRSTGRRGVVRRYEDLVDDLGSVIAWARGRWAGLPIFLFGHSNGGQVVLRSAIGSGEGITGVIVSNPTLRITMTIPPLKLAMGRFLMRVAPWVTLKAFESSEGMTSDPIMLGARSHDLLRHNRINPPFFFGMVAGGERLLAQAEALRPPLLMLLGARDPVVDGAASRDFFNRATCSEKSLLVYPDMMHEPLNEIGREQVLADIADWIATRLAVRAASSNQTGGTNPVRLERTDAREDA